jgi:hypothetical protein
MDFNKGSIDSQRIMEILLARMDTNTRALRETMKTNQDVLIKTVKQEMRAMVDACHKEMMACLGKTEANTEKTDPDQGMMQSTEEHQEFSKNDATVIPIKGQKKRRRARKPAAGRRGKPKELTQSDCGSGKKLAAACKMTRRATVAWRKKNVFRGKLVWKIRMQRNCGLRKRLVATGKKMTQKGWMFGKTRRVDPESSSVVKVINTRRHRRLKNEKTAGQIFEATFRPQIAKREDGSSVGSLKMRNWTLWRRRPPPKRKRN